MRALLITSVVAASTLLSLEIAARTVHGGNQEAETAPPSTRAPHVVVVPKRVEDTPPPPSVSSLMLIGNSHTYALPSLAQGGDLRPDPGATLIDELARQVRARTGTAAVVFQRVSYPNFLPLEVLTRLGQLLDRGHHPDVVVMGVAWSNVARGTSLRASLRALYRDGAFAERRLAELAALGADPRLVEAVRAERRREERAAEEARLQSAADAVDERLNRRAGGAVALLGESSAIRARVMRQLAYFIDLLVHETAGAQSNDVVAEELAVNLAALEAIAALLEARGARLLVYQSPARADLPPLVDESRRPAAMAALEAALARHGAALIDATHVVPDSMFGWEHDTPDRSHFVEPGHALLAATLAEALASRGLLAPLVAPR